MAKQKRSIYEYQQSFVFGIGMVYTIQAAELFYNVGTGLGLFETADVATLARLGASILAPILLCVLALGKGFLHFPTRWYHFFAVVITVVALTALGAFPIASYGLTAGLPSEVVYERRSSFLSLAGLGLVIALLISTIRCIAKGGPTDSTGVEPEYDAAPAEHADMRERSAAVSIHRSFLAFAGISIAMSGFILGRILLQSPPAAPEGVTIGSMNVLLALAGLGALGGLSLLFAGTTPRGVRRPSRWFHFFWVGIWLTILSLPVIGIFAAAGGAISFQAVGAGQSQETATALAAEYAEELVALMISAPGYAMSAFLGGMSSLVLIVTSLIVISRPVKVVRKNEALRPYSASTAASDVPDVPKKKDLRAAAIPEPKLPAMGALMKLYVAADWLVLRLLGLGLLGTGYLLWQMMEVGRVLPQLALNYGFPSLYALIAYCTLGAFLAVPFLLPKMIVAPRHVVGGMVKAGLLVIAGFVLRPVIPTAVNLLADEKYHATLMFLAPKVFNAVVGVAITSALFISFFRQLGRTPKTDYLGKPMIEMSQTELHRLREARMGIN
ncbi:hypothetical protein N9W17_03690 [Jannaschia sp.]|nr:hypothetical protein [Jannaschia sp.]